MIDELKKYFETTSKEKIMEDWLKTEEYDKIGPTVEEFMENNEKTKNMPPTKNETNN
jgi:hypothetical protein